MIRQISRWIEANRDILFVLCVFAVFIIVFIPLAPIIVDTLLIFNITISLIIILSAIYVKEPLEFSVFPTVLLITTALRLALNIATTRLILTYAAERGTTAAGKVIETFGFFVTGYRPGAAEEHIVVGFILFLIIVLVNFIVITRGSNRISEVAARFTLDAMPGKQMAIDADLNSGLISEEEARKRRDRITREADFYGAMDGATKFVRGDAIAGLIITIINIVGGLIIGPLRYGMDLTTAARTFSILTIGDGLAAQMPALIVSLAAGIIVARASTSAELGKDVIGQLFSGWKPLIYVALFLTFLILTPLPKIPLISLAAIIFLIAITLKRDEERTKREAIKRQQEELAKQPEKIETLLKVDPLGLEIGYGLIKLVEPKQGGTLLDRIQMMRRQIADDYGFIVPPIRIRDNLQLESDQYVVKIRGVKIAEGKILPDCYLAMDPGTATGPLEGIKTTDPVFGMPAYWITEENKQKAEAMGYTIVDATSVLVTHLIEIIKQHAAEILTREDVNHLLNNLKTTHPNLVDEVVNKVVTIAELHRILKELLREGVPIKDLPVILETVGDLAPKVKDMDILVEYTRSALARQITTRYLDPDGKMYVITLEPKLEETIKSATEKTEHGVYLNLPPAVLNKISQELKKEIEKVYQAGHTPVILCAPHVRPQVRRIIEAFSPGVAVLSYNEVAKGAKVEALGMLTMK